MAVKNSDISVYYDGKCSLCRWEIDFYRRRTPEDAVQWIDVTDNQQDLKTLGIRQKDLLMHLHVSSNKQIYRGVDAFIQIWNVVPGWHIAARIISFKPLKCVAMWMYEIFAQLRFRMYPHCRLEK